MLDHVGVVMLTRELRAALREHVELLAEDAGDLKRDLLYDPQAARLALRDLECCIRIVEQIGTHNCEEDDGRQCYALYVDAELIEFAARMETAARAALQDESDALGQVRQATAEEIGSREDQCSCVNRELDVITLARLVRTTVPSLR